MEMAMARRVAATERTQGAKWMVVPRTSSIHHLTLVHFSHFNNFVIRNSLFDTCPDYDRWIRYFFVFFHFSFDLRLLIC